MAAKEKRAEKDAKYSTGAKKVYRVKSEKGDKSEKRADDGIKRTGKVIHIVSKKDIDSSDN